MKKRALVVLLAVAMIFTFATAAMAADFSDMGNATKATKDAVARLTGLGVVNGYSDGTFKPNNNIRRDEFAKIAASCGGFANSADSMKNQPTGYSDVQTGIWSTGFINVASAQGYMKGTGNGKFTPAANITYAEVLTTALRMYGYNDNLVGPWPVNYVNQAVKDGLTEDLVNFSSSAPATRGDVCIIMSHALDQTMMEYSKDTDSFQEKRYAVNDGQGKTNDITKDLFTVAFGGEQVERVYIYGVDVDDYDAEDGVQYTVYAVNMDEVDKYQEGATVTEYEFTCDEKTEVIDGKFWALRGKFATVAYDKKNNAKKITVTSKEVTFTSVEATGESKVKADSTYKLRKGYTLADVSHGYLEEQGDKIAAKDLNENGTITLDPDGNVWAIVPDVEKAPGSAAVVAKIDTAKEKLFLNSSKGENVWKEAKKSVIVKDGKYITPADLKVGDILKSTPAGNVYTVVEASGNGKVGRNDGKKVTIGDKKVAMAESSTFVEVNKEDYTATTGNLYTSTGDDSLYDTEVSYVKAPNNTICLTIYTANASTKHDGILMGHDSVDADNDWNIPAELKSLTIYNEEGKSVTYSISADDQDDVQDAVEDMYYGAPVKFWLNDDDEITDIQFLAGDDEDSYAVSSSKYITVDGEKMAFTSDAKIFNLTSDKKKIKIDSETVKNLLAGDEVTIAGLELNGDLDGMQYLAYDTNKDGVITYLALTDFGGSSDKAEYAIVDGKSSDNKNNYIAFVGDDTDYKDDGTGDYDDVKGGNVVTYTIASGKVTGLTIISAKASDVDYDVITSITDTLIKYEGGSYELADNVKVFTWDADAEKYVIGETEDLDSENGFLVLAQNKDDQVTCIINIAASDLD